MPWGWRFFAGCMFVILAVLPSAGDKPGQAPKTVADEFEISLGGKVLFLQLAVTPAEQQRGLMERRDLKPGHGMIFVFERPQAMSFWMRNTPLPLDIGFLDASGVLREHYPLYPYDENVVRSRSSELQFAVELKQGWFRENKVFVDAKLDMKALAAALEARGFNSKDYLSQP
ncbi:MAG: DUF192 domain-containing protein [Opitutaceae bacterium]|nr:DUF192 domain-containing protein [Opitutaceae bacterium]